MECRFCSFVNLNGQRIIKCTRRDCDNWGETVTELAEQKNVAIEVKE